LRNLRNDICLRDSDFVQIKKAGFLKIHLQRPFVDFGPEFQVIRGIDLRLVYEKEVKTNDDEGRR